MKNIFKNHPNYCWYAEALCLGVTIGFSEVLLAIYYGSMELDSMSLAIFMTVPAAFGAMTQVAITRLRNYFGNARNLALASIAVQIMGLCTMASALFANKSDYTMMFCGQCLYWMGGMTSSSPTQEILAHNVDVSWHNQFFSRRAMLMTILTLVCNLTSAQILKAGLTPLLMGQLLSVAAVARTFSLLLVAAFGNKSSSRNTEIQIETNDCQIKQEHHSETSAKNECSDEAIVSIVKLSLMMMMFRCAVNISSPFYSAYMLRDIHLNFSVYSLLTAIPLITKTLCLTNWAKLLDDNRKFEGLAIATFAIGAVPVMWSIGSSPQWLGVLQIISGLSWAGFDLISILLVQHMYPRSITQKLGLFMALSSVGSVVGGLLGGLILKSTESYHALFAISGCLRLLTGFGLLLYLRKNHLFRFQNLRLKSGLATLVTVRPSIEAAAKIFPLPNRKDTKSNRVA